MLLCKNVPANNADNINFYFRYEVKDREISRYASVEYII